MALDTKEWRNWSELSDMMTDMMPGFAWTFYCQCVEKGFSPQIAVGLSNNAMMQLMSKILEPAKHERSEEEESGS